MSISPTKPGVKLDIAEKARFLYIQVSAALISNHQNKRYEIFARFTHCHPSLLN
jgi:hypothetical protein